MLHKMSDALDEILRRAAAVKDENAAGGTPFSYEQWMQQLGASPPPPPPAEPVPKTEEQWLQPLQTLLGLHRPAEPAGPPPASAAALFEERLRKAFHSIDGDANGNVGKRQLYRALQSVGADGSSAEMLALYQSADKDGSGHLNWREFKALGAKFPVLADLGGRAMPRERLGRAEVLTQSRLDGAVIVSWRHAMDWVAAIIVECRHSKREGRASSNSVSAIEVADIKRLQPRRNVVQTKQA